MDAQHPQVLIRKRGENPKKMESHPTMKKLGIFQRPRSASLGGTPKNQVMGKKRSAPSPPLEKLLRGERVALRPLMPRWPRARPRIKKGTGMWSQRKERKKKEKKGEKGGGPCAKSAMDYHHA